MASITGTPAVYTDAGEVLADTHTASAGGVEIFLCASERGASAGTSPGTLSYGGVNALATTGGAVTDLCQIAAAQRAHRWYHIPRANHPGTGSHAVAMTWAGADNVAVAVVEVSATGAVTIIDDNQSSADATVPITAGSGDLTIGCAQANSATPAFSPASGQTEHLESVWYSNTGHVIGTQTGAQTAASWTGAGSICASAFVIHEESGGGDEIELGGEALGGGRVSGAAAPLITLGGGLMGGAHVVGSLTPLVAGAGEARGAGRSSASASSSVSAEGAAEGAGRSSASASSSVSAEGAAEGAGRSSASASSSSSATAEARGAGYLASASAPLGVAQGAARGTGWAEGEAVPRGVATAGAMGAGRVTVAASSSVSAEGEARGAGRITSAAPANELGGAARGAGYVMGSVTPTAGLAGTARGGVATASAAVTARSVAAGIARGVGRALGAVLSAIGLGGGARAAGRVAGRVGEIATWAPGPPERTRVAMSRALRSRVSYHRGNVRVSGFRARRVK